METVIFETVLRRKRSSLRSLLIFAPPILFIFFLLFFNPLSARAGKGGYDLNGCKNSLETDVALACDQYHWIVRRYEIPLTANDDPVIQARTACKNYFRVVFQARNAVCSYMLEEARIGAKLAKAGELELDQESSISTVQAGYQEYLSLHKFFNAYFEESIRKLDSLGLGKVPGSNNTADPDNTWAYLRKITLLGRMAHNNGNLEYSCSTNWRAADKVHASEKVPGFVMDALETSSNKDIRMADENIRKLVITSLRHSSRRNEEFSKLVVSVKQSRSKMSTFNKDVELPEPELTDTALTDTELTGTSIVDEVVKGVAADKLESGIIKVIIEKPVAVATTRLVTILGTKKLTEVLTGSLAEKMSKLISTVAGAGTSLVVEYLLHGKVDGTSLLMTAAAIICGNIYCLIISTTGEILMRQEKARRERFEKFLLEFAVPKCEKKNAHCVSSHDIAREWGKREKQKCNFPSGL